MYIESPPTETDEQFRAYVRELLRTIFGERAERFEFRVGRRVERRSQFFRELAFAEGIVWCQIAMRARQPGAIARTIILQGMVRDTPHCWEVRLGIETEFGFDQLIGP